MESTTRNRVIASASVLLFLVFVGWTFWRAHEADLARAAAEATSGLLASETVSAKRAAALATQALIESSADFEAKERVALAQIAKLNESLLIERNRLSTPYAPRHKTAPLVGDLGAAQESARELESSFASPDVVTVLGGSHVNLDPQARMIEGRALVTLTTTAADVVSEVVGVRLPSLMRAFTAASSAVDVQSARVTAAQAREEKAKIALARLQVLAVDLQRETDAAHALATAEEQPFVLFDSRLWAGVGLGAAIAGGVMAAIIVSTSH